MVISRESKKKVYHREDCIYAARISSENKKYVSEAKLKKLGYKECEWCGGLHGVYLNLRKNPRHYLKNAKSMKYYWDNFSKALCVQTYAGFWKIVKSWNTGKYALYHLNHSVFVEKRDPKARMNGRHHRQTDVEQTTDIPKLLLYISEHDKAKQILQQKDYRSLPQKTKRQKKYYRKAAKKARKQYNKHMDYLFKQIQNEGRK